MNNILYSIILFNCIWDFMSSFAILFNYPNSHTNIWINPINRDNEAAKHLMTYLILYWGSMRLFGLIFNLKTIIIFSYIFESVVFLCEALLFKTMDVKSSVFISILSLILVILLINDKI